MYNLGKKKQIFLSWIRLGFVLKKLQSSVVAIVDLS